MQFIGGSLNLGPEVFVLDFLILVDLVWVVKEMVAKFGRVKQGKLLSRWLNFLLSSNDIELKQLFCNTICCSLLCFFA